jgi:hypothetical protein
MQCKNEFNFDFMSDNFTQSFVNKELKAHRSNMLFEEQKCFLPETQVDVEYELQMRVLKTTTADLMKERNILMKSVHALTDQISTNKDIIEMWNIANYRENNFNTTEESEKIVFIKQCPDENCKGYLSTKWNCGICKIKVCCKCHLILDLDHKCNEDDILTAKLLMKDTKQCPCCSTPIHKIADGGCDQMWCVKCHTCFSWKTLKILKEIIHNPHFYQWQRDKNAGIAPRVPGDNPCTEFPEIEELISRLSDIKIYKKQEIHKKDIFAFYRLMVHVHEVEFPNFQWDDVNETEYEMLNLKQRISYMLKELSDTKYKSLLVKQHFNKQKKQEIFQIFEMFYNASLDILKNFIDNSKISIEETVKDLHFLCEFTNKGFSQFGAKYKIQPYFIFHQDYDQYMFITVSD